MKDGLFYFSLIDPLLKKLHDRVAAEIPEVAPAAFSYSLFPVLYFPEPDHFRTDHLTDLYCNLVHHRYEYQC
jgi:hypothetical protein